MKYKNRIIFKSYLQLILLALSAGAIFRLVYLRTSFQEVMQNALRIDTAQLNELYMWLGFAIVLGYIPSGWLADRFSSKKLIILALVLTAVFSIMLSFLPPFYITRWIFLGLGVSSVFVFWTAHMRSTKLLDKHISEGKLFGLLDGGRGASEALLASISVVIFNTVLSNYIEASINTANERAMRYVFLFFAFIQLILAVFIAFFLENNIIEKNKKHGSKKFFSFLGFLKDKNIRTRIVLMSVIIFSGYTLFFTNFSFYGLLVVNHKVSESIAMIVLSVSLWMRPLGAVLGGFLADRVSKTIVLTVAMMLSILSILLLLLFSLPMFLQFNLVVFIGLMGAIIRGVYWSLLSYIDVKEDLLGRVIGFISFIGYIPDVFLPWISVLLFKHFSDVLANVVYLYGSVVIGVIGLMATFYFYTITEKNMP